MTSFPLDQEKPREPLHALANMARKHALPGVLIARRTSKVNSSPSRVYKRII